MIAFTVQRAAHEITGERKGQTHATVVAMLKDAIREGDIPTRSAEGEPLLLTGDLRSWVARLPEYHADIERRAAARTVTA